MMMSVISPHARVRHGIAGGFGALSLALLASGCSASLQEDSRGLRPGAGNDFGSESELFERDAGALDASQPIDGMPPDAGTVSVRFVHGIVNLGQLQVCHLPNLEALTPGAQGGRQGVPLPLVASLGEVTDFQILAPLTSGALSLHLVPSANLDAGIPDAGAPLEADDTDMDAATDDDGTGGPEFDDACADDTRVALLPLENGNSRGSSANSVPAPTTARTLLASGVALDSERLAQRQSELEAEYLAQFPDEAAAAATAAQEAIDKLIDTYGPKLTLTNEPVAPSAADGFALGITHLVPDVATPNYGPGGIRLCVTAGTLENAVEPALPELPFSFRSQTQVVPSFAQNVAYRFRIFAASKFDVVDAPSINQDCATTSLVPLAELSVPEEDVRTSRARSLLFTGAVAPSSLCAPLDVQTVIKAGCPYSSEELAPRIQLLPAHP